MEEWEGLPSWFQDSIFDIHLRRDRGTWKNAVKDNAQEGATEYSWIVSKVYPLL